MLEHTDAIRFKAFLDRVSGIVADASMFDSKTEKRVRMLADKIWQESRASWKAQRMREIIAEEASKRRRRRRTS
jgi:hypothetical protein